MNWNYQIINKTIQYLIKSNTRSNREYNNNDPPNFLILTSIDM